MTRDQRTAHRGLGWAAQRARSGTLLVIVAGLCAMLAALTLTYLADVRSRAYDGGEEVNAAQARILLYSACAFICESRNCGGPITTDPGYAAEPYQGGMPAGTTGSSRVYPVVPRQWPALAIGFDPSTAQWMDNPTMDRNSMSGMAEARVLPHPGSPTDTWFRIYRVSGTLGVPGTQEFIVTVGIGQSYGYRTWSESSSAAAAVPSGDAQHALNYGADIPDAATLDDARRREYREYYQVTWVDPGPVGPPPADLTTAKPYFGHIQQITRLTVEPPSW
jgi:hypothetical protein